jgi:formylglycine-generating enzyme required for sulfatase activity
MSDTDTEKQLNSVEFVPLESSINTPSEKRSIKPTVLLLCFLLAGVVMSYLLLAKAVIFVPQPANASFNVSGLSFNIGNNYLLLPGERRVKAKSPGYFDLDKMLLVDSNSNQELILNLQPLPGRVVVTSELADLKVAINGENRGSVPGTIDQIPKGVQNFSFSKRRYFTLNKEIDVLGLDKTQNVDINLAPAWGFLALDSSPSGAEVSIDGVQVGTTPLTTEVLETGSEVLLELAGYQSINKTLKVQAGTSAVHPRFDLQIAEGLLNLSSKPSGASVIVNKAYKGVTPLSLSLPSNRPQNLELFLEGYRKNTQTLTVEPDSENNLPVILKPNLGRIVLTVSPAEAQISVDNQSVGVGNMTLELPSKSHSISVSKEGYVTQTVDITPYPTQDNDVLIQLLTTEQAYWAARPQKITTSVNSTLKLFKPDVEFSLGAPRRQPGRRANEVERNVALYRPFYLGIKEISNAQYKQWRPNHNSASIKNQSLDLNNQPVSNVSWNDAALFCNWLSEQENLPQFYNFDNEVLQGFNWNATGYRLPTEAEWAWAARFDLNQKPRLFPWNNGLYPPVQPDANYADETAKSFIPFTLSGYKDNYAVSAPVGSFKPNAKGIYDMAGNVAEWVNDFYAVNSHRGKHIVDARGPSAGSRHVIRDASWALASRSELRLSYRDAGSTKRLDVGFRIARYVDEQGKSP